MSGLIRRGASGFQVMDMLKRLKRLACRHEYGWSERRQADVCYHCGQVREAATDGPLEVDLPAPREDGR